MGISTVQIPNGVRLRGCMIYKSHGYGRLVLHKVVPLPVSKPTHEDTFPIQRPGLHTGGCQRSLSFHSGQLEREKMIGRDRFRWQFFFDCESGSPSSCRLSAFAVSSCPCVYVLIFHWVFNLWVCLLKFSCSALPPLGK